MATALDRALRPRERLLVASALEGADARFLVERVQARGGRTVVHVARDAPRLARLVQQIRFFAPELTILVLPAWDCVPYDRISPNPAIMAERLATLAALAERREATPLFVATTANAILQRVPDAATVRRGRLVARAGQSVDRDGLLAHLERHGYRRAGTVVEPGEYAVRGGLVDLWPTGAGKPLRLDFFGSVLESIRRFDPLTQRTQDRVKGVSLQPVSEVMLDQAAIERFRTGYLREFGAVTGDPLLEAVTAGRSFPGMEHWLPLFHEQLATVLDYLPEDALLSFDPQARDAIRARAALIGEHYAARREPVAAPQSFGTAPYRALPPERLYLDEQSLERLAAGFDLQELSVFRAPPVPPAGTTRVLELDARPGRDFAAERADRSQNLFDQIVAHVRSLLATGHRPLIASHSEGAAERLRQILADHGLDLPAPIRSAAELSAGEGARIAVLPIAHGVTAPGLCILGEEDLLGDRLQAGAARRRRADKFIQDLSAIGEGDLVVHAEHGIGRFDGLVTLEIGGAPHDCLRLTYAGNDKLFVPVENLEVLSRYGHSDAPAQLDKLGGVGWQARKAKVKQRIREMAGELIQIAAQRALRKGLPAIAPPGAYDEFTARFPYDETDDQLAAIEAVLADLGSGVPMDRLICGDVGFGKTEVALRAAFVVAMSGRQVAVLAPTTLLARQHFKVFAERFAGLPVKVASLSRFVGAREQAEVREALASGEVAIVVGTHAVLGKQVRFKDLGLVVIDEEQHFGVAQKERLKQLRAEVHVLTMTATPIPRTLQMALGGMKDMSVIATPPVDRLAVRTFVMPADPVVLREAIMREHFRGGQSFYVCPKIADQPKLAADLKRLVPEIRIGVANGQMPAAELEAVMAEFYDRKLDLLLATNIIESGLDIPNANTLIVHRADMFGLSQLYQLRGRVGRAKQRGYAYFTVPADKTLQETAERRLQVIQSLDGLGAGFQLASHDLDIRGAGNLLGDEQSGHVKEVGFELYNHMLEEAIAALKAEGAGEPEAATGEWTPQITIDAAALMPESYIGDLDLRLAMYRRLASLETPEEIDAFAAELVDRFGPLPKETRQLLELVAIKQACKRANVQKLDAGPKGIVLTLHQNRFPRPERLVGLIAESKGRLKVRPDHRIVVGQETASPAERLKLARTIAGQLAQLAA